MCSWSRQLVQWGARAERWLLWLILFALPFQRRHILFQSDWNFDEWRSGFLYGTDILVFVLVGLWTWRTIARRSLDRSSRVVLACGGALTIAAACSAFTALVPAVSWYQVAKLVEFTLLAACAANLFSRVPWRGTLAALVTGGVVQAGIAIAQFIRQADLGLRVLGESVIGPHTAGVATFYTAAGEKVIRAYGTTPHPNVLAVYLILALAAAWVLYLTQPSDTRSRRWWLLAAQVLVLWALAATFSRTVLGLAAVAGMGTVMWWWLRRPVWRRHVTIAAAVAILASVAFVVAYHDEVAARARISSDEEAVTLRVYYDAAALHAGSSANWFGVGIGNFTTWLELVAPHQEQYLYQPAHNLLLLAYAETGTIGTTALLILLTVAGVSVIRAIRTGLLGVVPLAAVCCVVLAASMFDHLFWTLQQGRLIFWFLLAAAFAVGERASVPRGDTIHW